MRSQEAGGHTQEYHREGAREGQRPGDQIKVTEPASHG